MSSHDDLVNSMFRLTSECMNYDLQVPHTVQQSLTSFIASLEKATPPQLAFIKDRHLPELQRIKRTLVAAKAPRNLIDKVFQRYLDIGKSMPMHVTRLFEEFIKGITYFSNEADGSQPVYHRLFSCGPKGDAHRQGHLICTAGLSAKELRRRRPLIEKCYIERLIYHELFLHTTLHFANGSKPHVQDAGHMFRIDLTRQDFETCFPNTSIVVAVTFSDHYPCELQITRSTPQDTTVLQFRKSVSIDVFGGKSYGSLVECRKVARGLTWAKVSSFADPGVFKETAAQQPLQFVNAFNARNSYQTV